MNPGRDEMCVLCVERDFAVGVALGRRAVDRDEVEPVVTGLADRQRSRPGGGRVAREVALRQRLPPEGEAECLALAVADDVVDVLQVGTVEAAARARRCHARHGRLEDVEVRQAADPVDAQAVRNHGIAVVRVERPSVVGVVVDRDAERSLDIPDLRLHVDQQVVWRVACDVEALAFQPAGCGQYLCVGRRVRRHVLRVRQVVPVLWGSRAGGCRMSASSPAESRTARPTLSRSSRLGSTSP